MKIYVDGRAGCCASRTGKGQWVLKTVEALLQTTPLTILTDGSPVPAAWRNAHASYRILPKGLFWHIAAARTLKREQPNVFIAPSSFIVPALLPKCIRCVPVVHDLIAFQKDPHAWKATLIERLTLPRALKKAVSVLTISEATKRDLLVKFSSIADSAISVVYAGPLDPSPPPSIPDGHTILCPATLCPRKNQRRLIEAYARLPGALRSRFRLLLVGGRGWKDGAIIQCAQSTAGVEWKGYVPEDEYRMLLSKTTVLAFPSLYEGFGLPVLDALQRGIPVLTTDRGSLPEVVGSCAVTVDPLSTESISNGLSVILTDESLRRRLRACGPRQAEQFSWKRTAELLLKSLAKP